MQFIQFTAARADSGAVLPYASATVYLTGTTTLASLFSATGSGIGNPTKADATGLLGFAAADGLYDVAITSADGSYAAPKITKLQLVDLLNVVGTITSGRLGCGTWAELAAITTTSTPVSAVVGQVAEVPLSDTGTHTDPAGGTVNNAGVFKLQASPAGWHRIYDGVGTQVAVAAAQAQASATAAAGSEARAAGAIRARIDTTRRRYDPVTGKQLFSAQVATDGALVFGRFFDGTNVDYSAAQNGGGGPGLGTVFFDTTRRRYDPVTGKQLAICTLAPDGSIVSASLADGSQWPNALVQGIACWGDSITETPWPEAIGMLLNRAVYQGGIGSQQMPEIMGRQGATAFPFTLQNNRMVAGANTVTAINGAPITGMASAPIIDAQFLSARAGGSGRSCTGWLGACHGTLVQIATGGPPSTSETYTFTPDPGQPGLPVNCPSGTPFLIDNPYDDWTTILWPSRNDYLSLTLAQIAANDAAMMARVPHNRKLILPVLNGANEPAGSGDGYNKIFAIEQQRAAQFPRNFLNMRRYLIDRALPDLGIAPTAQDLADIANDIYPSSLRRDGLHPNLGAGVTAISRRIALELATRGW